MFNFLLCCVKKKKQKIQPVRKNANEMIEIIEMIKIDKDIICNKEKEFVYNKKLKYKIKIDENGKGIFDNKKKIHKLFLENRVKRKKLNKFKIYTKYKE